MYQEDECMNEKLFKTVCSAGIMNLVMGILILVSGISTGVLLVVSGARLLGSKKDVII